MSSRRTMWVGTIVVWGAVALPACDRTGGESAESEQTAVERGAGRSSPSQEGGGADDRWRRVQRAKLDDSAHTRLERAKKAQRALGKRLKKELTSSISEKSFSGAVEFCHSRAPEVAAEVAEEYDVRIGRTSHRLRNPDNAPPVWAEEAVARKKAREYVYRGPERQIGYLKPIELKGLCVNCHGTRDKLAPGVSEKLAKYYPEDRATGFEVGDLRGWFWVEVGSDGR